MLNKSFLWFLGSLFCAFLGFSYLFFIYLKWDDVAVTPEESAVEVTLPVINWGKYQDLSKRIE